MTVRAAPFRTEENAENIRSLFHPASHTWSAQVIGARRHPTLLKLESACVCVCWGETQELAERRAKLISDALNARFEDAGALL